jgi:pilus assembly protein CpaB
VTEYEFVAASRPIKRGEVIHAQDGQIVSASSRAAPGTVFSLKDIDGRVAMRDIALSEPFSNENSTMTGGSARLSELGPPGMRAVSLRVTEENAIANLIQPGDFVDVVSVSGVSGAPAGRNAKTVLQNIQVLAVNDSMIGEPAKTMPYRTITLAVTPKQAAILAVARSAGVEWLSLRAAHDDRIVQDGLGASSTAELSLASGEPRPSLPKRANGTNAVELILGDTHKELRIAGGRDE